MRVTVKLFAGFQKGRFAVCDVDLQPTATVQELVDLLGLPTPEIGILLINGRHVPSGQTMVDGDVVAVFPKIGGG